MLPYASHHGDQINRVRGGMRGRGSDMHVYPDGGIYFRKAEKSIKRQSWDIKDRCIKAQVRSKERHVSKLAAYIQ